MFLGQTTKWGFTEISRYLELNLDICGAILDLLVSEPLHPLLLNNAVIVTIARLIHENKLGITSEQRAALVKLASSWHNTYGYIYEQLSNRPVPEA